MPHFHTGFQTLGGRNCSLSLSPWKRKTKKMLRIQFSGWQGWLYMRGACPQCPEFDPEDKDKWWKERSDSQKNHLLSSACSNTEMQWIHRIFTVIVGELITVKCEFQSFSYQKKKIIFPLKVYLICDGWNDGLQLSNLSGSVLSEEKVKLHRI